MELGKAELFAFVSCLKEESLSGFRSQINIESSPHLLLTKRD